MAKRRPVHHNAAERTAPSERHLNRVPEKRHASDYWFDFITAHHLKSDHGE
jgi:hypothetical protein